jgi:uncharacterized protein (DUF1810 family)
MNNLERFISAQDSCYDNVIKELSEGGKKTHWIWFIFPQCMGLGKSYNSCKYAIKSQQEAIDYLNNETLKYRLITCCEFLLNSKTKSISQILPPPDDLKLKSSLTLFLNVKPNYTIFKNLLIKYFDNKECTKTREFLKL